MKKLFLILMYIIASSVNAVELTVHHAPGGPSDKITRLIAKNLPTYTIQNRPGAAGRIAVKHILQGNSVLTATIPQIYVTNPLMFPDLEYDPETDLEIVGVVGIMTNLLICNSKSEIKNFKDLLTTTRSLSFATSGYGSSDHIASEALFVHTKAKHIIIPYPSGGSKSVFDVVGGNVDCTFGNYATVKPIMNDPRITVLFSSHAIVDKIPTWEQYFKETFPYQSYIALVVAKSMELEKKKQLTLDISKVFSNKEYRDAVRELGLLPVGSTELWIINSVIKENKSLARFIQNNKLQIKQ
jgi:tripartite-type tricarboxylate transporter receptor subunit TctC